MMLQNPSSLFAMLTEPAARAATAPILALALGVILVLVCEITGPLRSFRPLVFVAAVLAALVFELRMLLGAHAPGAVLDGTLVADATSAAWGVLFLAGTLLAWTYGLGRQPESEPFRGEHDALMLSASMGMLLMAGAGDLIVFFVGLELLSIPLYALAAFQRWRASSVEAGLKYFLLGSFSSALFLFGTSLLYTDQGSLSIPALIEGASHSTLARAGIALVAASLFFKISVFPFHSWVPDVYQGSPTHVTALMATGTKAAALAFLVSQAAPLFPDKSAHLVAILALLTMAVGNLGALVQEDLKRMLAYSGIAHAGTVLLLVAVRMGGGDGSATLRAAIFYMAAYLFTATGAFGLVALLERSRQGTARIDSLRGLARSRPYAAAALTLFLLSLGGIPATGGFLGKWFVFAAVVRADMVPSAVIGALLSVLALAYYLRVVVVLWMQPPAASSEPFEEAGLRAFPARLATAVCALLVLATGLVPALFLAPLGS
jgi:NADH-quinone oxidoreductase subunit N